MKLRLRRTIFVINAKKGIGLVGTAILFSIVWGPSRPISPGPSVPPVQKLVSHADHGPGFMPAM